jgi:hypothetical protein
MAQIVRLPSLGGEGRVQQEVDRAGAFHKEVSGGVQSVIWDRQTDRRTFEPTRYFGRSDRAGG